MVIYQRIMLIHLKLNMRNLLNYLRFKVKDIKNVKRLKFGNHHYLQEVEYNQDRDSRRDQKELNWLGVCHQNTLTIYINHIKKFNVN
ncbi:unnamed protein product [Paramecium sonneborni]|uniref:Uncharacterized protein n=1 Tax=Paramecium sonneborni TaxID=65129 RepID=A0A8S1QBF0_9CILI|nr:unnamed protein product [Paramecium sonneborni]